MFTACYMSVIVDKIYVLTAAPAIIMSVAGMTRDHLVGILKIPIDTTNVNATTPSKTFPIKIKIASEL